MWIITTYLHYLIPSKLHTYIFIKTQNFKSSKYANILKKKLNKYSVTAIQFQKGKKNSMTRTLTLQ